MPEFIYRVKDKNGLYVSGIQEAIDKWSIAETLNNLGYFVLDIVEKRISVTSYVVESFANRVKIRDILVFTRQMSTMLKSGLSMSTALKILLQQTQNKSMRDVIAGLAHDIEGGNAFSAALSKYPRIFSSVYMNMVKAGETSGNLQEILNRIVNIYEAELETGVKIKSAFIYPVIVVSVAGAVITFLTLFVFPKFVEVFSAGGVALPLPTKLLMNFSIFVQKFWLLILVAAIGIIFLFIRCRLTTQGRFIIDKYILKVPVLGDMLSKIIIARFCKTLAMLHASGVPILQALSVAEDSMGNLAYARAIMAVRASVREGEFLAKTIASSGLFSPLVVQMISTGEETGSLDEMLNEVANFYEQEVNYTIKNLTTLLEPALVMVIGAIVGLTALAMFLPLFDMMKLVGS